jgi:hypothetical protein
MRCDPHRLPALVAVTFYSPTHHPSSIIVLSGLRWWGEGLGSLPSIRGARGLYLTSDTAACYDEHAMPCHAVIPELGPEVSESRP